MTTSSSSSTPRTEFSDDLMGYLTVSEGYRSGGGEFRPRLRGAVAAGAERLLIFPDEVLDPAGHDDQLRNRPAQHPRSTAACWRTLAVSSSTGRTSRCRRRRERRPWSHHAPTAKAAESTGFEFNARWQVTDELQVAALYSYNQARR